MCIPLVVAAQALGHVCNYLSGFWCSSLCFNNIGILAKFWSVKYINPSCWPKLMSILGKWFCCCLFNVSLPLCVWPCIFGNFHASLFWFCTIYFEEDSWFFYFYCVLFHVCGLCVGISHICWAYCEMPFCVVALSADPEEGTGGLDPPGNSQVIWVSTGIKQLDPPPGKSWTPWKMLDLLWNLKNDSFLWN